MGGPLAHLDDMFESGLPRCNGEGRRALDHERIHEGQVVGALNAAHRVEQLVGIIEAGHHHFSAEPFKCCAAGVQAMNHGPYRYADCKQCMDHRQPGPSGCTGDKNFWGDHGMPLELM